MRRLRWLIAAIATVVVLGAAAVVFVATLDLNAYRDDVRAALESAIGRRVVIDGRLGLAWTGGFGLTAADVTVANAAWAKEPEMASVGSLAVGVDLLPMLSGEVVIRRLRMADVRLVLERNADGHGNWELPGAGGASGGGAAAGGGSLPTIGKVDLARVTVIWKSGPGTAEQVYRIDQLSLSGDDPANPVALSLAADFDGDPVALTGSLPGWQAIRQSGAALPVDIKGTVGGKAVALAATFRVGDDEIVQADGIKASYGDLDATGELTVALAGERPRITGKIAAGTVDLAKLGGEGKAKSGGPALDRQLPADNLKAVDADLALSADRLIADRWIVDKLTASLKMENGVVTIDPLTGTMADGPVAAKVELDAGKGLPRLAVSGKAGGMDMGKLYRALTGDALIQGRGEAAFDLHGRGDTVRGLLRTADGYTRLVVREGAIMDRYWELIAEDLTTRFLPFVNDGDRGKLNCLVSRFEMSNGIARSKVLMIDSDRVTVAGDGKIDLGAQTVDMRLVPRPKDPSLFSLATPILLTGPLSDPKPAPDPVGVAKGIGGIAAGAMIGPIGVLLPFLSAGNEDNPCPAAIAAAEGKTGAGGSKATKEQDKPGAIEGLFNKLRKSIE